MSKVVDVGLRRLQVIGGWLEWHVLWTDSSGKAYCYRFLNVNQAQLYYAWLKLRRWLTRWMPW